MSLFKKGSSKKGDVFSESTCDLQTPPERGYWCESKSEYEYDYDIRFLEELSSGALVFQIIDVDCEHAGHVIVSPSNGEPKIFESTFFEFEDDDRKYLIKQAKAFCNAIR